MATPGKAPHAYQQTQVLGSDQRQLTVLMFQALLRYVTRAEHAVRRNDLETKADALAKAQAVLSELICSLDDEIDGELVGGLRRLYAWLQRQMVEVDICDDLDVLADVTDMTRRLADAWEEALRICRQEESASRAA